MKNKLKIYLNNFNYIISNQIFKLTFIFMISIAILSFTLVYNKSFLEGFIMITQNGWIIGIIILIVLLTTTNTYHAFEKNTYYIIRLENKKKYLNELLKTILFNNLIILLITYFLIFIALLFLMFSDFGNNLYYNYNITKLTYLIIHLIRTFILFMLISLINTLLLKIINNKIVFSLNGILIALIITLPYNAEPIKNISNLPLFIGNYLSFTNFYNFKTEILCSVIFIILIVITTTIIYRIVYKSFKKVGD